MKRILVNDKRPTQMGKVGNMVNNYIRPGRYSQQCQSEKVGFFNRYKELEFRESQRLEADRIRKRLQRGQDKENEDPTRASSQRPVQVTPITQESLHDLNKTRD